MDTKGPEVTLQKWRMKSQLITSLPSLINQNSVSSSWDGNVKARSFITLIKRILGRLFGQIAVASSISTTLLRLTSPEQSREVVTAHAVTQEHAQTNHCLVTVTATTLNGAPTKALSRTKTTCQFLLSALEIQVSYSFCLLLNYVHSRE